MKTTLTNLSTIGAGDTFIAGIILATIMFPSSSQKIIDLATYLASCKITQEGFQGLAVNLGQVSNGARGLNCCVEW